MKSVISTLGSTRSVIAVLALTFVATSVTAQEVERKLYDTAFTEKRPAAKASSTKRKQGRYRKAGTVATAKDPVTVPVDTPMLGVTVWRLRKSLSADATAARILVHGPSEKNEEWTPERIEADTALAEGQRVRLSIESPREGYLYVVDREQYADGTYGPAYVIFPTTRLRAGDNRVASGSIIEIPSQADDPVYFTLKRSRPDHVAEVITVLVSLQPLEMTIGKDSMALDAVQFSKWRSLWGAHAERLELVDGAGTPYTQEEKKAGAGEPLTQEGPLPQTIFALDANPGSPVLVDISLRIAR